MKTKKIFFGCQNIYNLASTSQFFPNRKFYETGFSQKTQQMQKNCREKLLKLLTEKSIKKGF